MTTIITYEVETLTVEGEERIEVTSVDKTLPTPKYGVSCPTKDFTEAQALLKFKDLVTRELPNENAMIFITKEQSGAMEGYTEKEKHGDKQ